MQLSGLTDFCCNFVKMRCGWRCRGVSCEASCSANCGLLQKRDCGPYKCSDIRLLYSTVLNCTEEILKKNYSIVFWLQFNSMYKYNVHWKFQFEIKEEYINPTSVRGGLYHPPIKTYLSTNLTQFFCIGRGKFF